MLLVRAVGRGHGTALSEVGCSHEVSAFCAFCNLSSSVFSPRLDGDLCRSLGLGGDGLRLRRLLPPRCMPLGLCLAALPWPRVCVLVPGRHNWRRLGSIG